MAGSGNTNAAQSPKLTGIAIQTSAYGVPVPVVYGTTRIGWNLIDYLDFKNNPKSTSTSGKGGLVGGGGGKGGGTTDDYTASIIGLLCEGPISSIYSSWVSQTHSAGTPGFTVSLGAYGQAAWSYLSNYAGHSLGYSGMVTVEAANYDLGASANLPNLNWEVEAFLQNTAPGTYGGNGCRSGGDADASQVVPDMLTNAVYGMGMAANSVGQVTNNNEARTCALSVTANNASGFSYNLSVYDATAGVSLTCVTGTPGAGQYSFTSGGVYAFNAAQVGHAIQLNYASVGTMVNYQNFTIANGLWISPAYDQYSPCSTNIDDIALATYSEVIVSSGVLQMIPRGTVGITANGKTYSPVNTALFSLTVDDFMANSASNQGDPVVLTRKRKSDQINDLKLEVLDRANQYAPAIVHYVDQALVEQYGRRAGSAKSLHLFCDINAATTSLHMQAQDEYLLNSYSFQVDVRYSMLDPMDVVALTEPNFAGISNLPVRTKDLQENDDGSISIIAEEFPGSIGAAPAFVLTPGQGLIQDFNVDPGNAAAPAIFDVPVQLSQGATTLESWLATMSATQNPNWGGCEIWLSTDGTTYPFSSGTMFGPSKMGLLTAVVPAGTDPDTTSNISVDLSKSFGVLNGGTKSDADNDVTLCYIADNGGEYISYQQATLTATYNYSLGTLKVGDPGYPHAGYLRRGQWGSTPVSHAIGAQFVRLDSGVFQLPYTPADIGKTFWVKLVSFNIYGAGKQSIASVPAYSHTIAGPPVPAAVQNFNASQNGNAFALSWTDLTSAGIKGYDILYGPIGGTVNTATLLTEASRQTAETTVGIPPGGWAVYIRGRNIANQVGPASSVNVTVINSNTTIASLKQEPDWLGTKVGYLLHYTGVLTPDSLTLAGSCTLFSQLYCGFNPVANPTYTAPTYDEGFNSASRIYFNVGGYSAPWNTLGPTFSTYLDTWLTGASDPNVYAPWTVGYITSRYNNARIIDSAAAPQVLSQFDIGVDAPLTTTPVGPLAVSAIGTTFTFAALGLGPFHNVPNVQGTPADTNGTAVGASGITATQVTITYYNGSLASPVAGNVNLIVSGN